MAKLNTKSTSKTHRIIIYGGPKSGKTKLAGDLAEHYKLIWVDLENGHETLFQLPQAWQKNIELINIPDTRSYPIAIETCLKMVKQKVSICEVHGKVSCMVCKREESDIMQANPEATAHKDLFVDIDLNNLGPKHVVIFDSLTQLSNSAIAFITKNQSDDYKLNYEDWGNLGKLLDIFLSHLQQAKYNVIVISHETEAETEGKKKTLVPVGGTRNFSRNIAKYFDHVIYAERKNKKHIFSSSSQYATTILTGSRTGVNVEDHEVASLLPIFMPESYPKSSVNASTNTGKIKGRSTKDILSKLQSKTKSK